MGGAADAPRTEWTWSGLAWWTSQIASVTPDPTGLVLPDYAGANVRGIVPALLAPRGAPKPAWMPSVVAGADQVVLLVLDGLGWEQLQARRDIAPTHRRS